MLGQRTAGIILLVSLLACSKTIYDEDYVPRPAPAFSGPIDGDQVSLDEARRRIDYSISAPEESVVGAELQEVWVTDELGQVYLIYANDLQVSMSGHPELIDYSELADDPFKATVVRGSAAIGKDTTLRKLSSGEYLRIKARLSWWVNGVDITIYHKSLSMDELKTIAETMPDPVWK